LQASARIRRRAGNRHSEGQIEAIASLIELTNIPTPRRSNCSTPQCAIARVPEARDRSWRVAQRDLSRAEMERHTANEEYEELSSPPITDAFVNAWPAQAGRRRRDRTRLRCLHRGLPGI
jgi:hypothetical protein